MPQRNVASNFTFEQQRVEINNLAQDFWSQKGTVDTALTTFLKHDGSNAFTGGTLNVPSAFTISANSGSGTLTISGNLDVTGTTTTVSTANLEVTDKNILIAKGSTSDSQADGAGITIDSATDITFNFVDAKDALVSSIGLEGTTFLKAPYGQFTGSGTATVGQGVEINAPDANTGQIISYDRANTAYKELRVKGSSVGIYGGTSNALVGTFNSNGLTLESGSLSIPDSIEHSGDGNTKIRFPSNDTIAFETGGSERFSISDFLISVQSGFQLGFLASSGPSPSIKSGGTDNQSLYLTTGTGNNARLTIAPDGKVDVIGELAVGSSIGINGSGGSAYPLHVYSGQKYLVGLKNTAANSGIGYPWLTHDSDGGQSSLVVHFNGIGDTFYIRENGTAKTTGAFTSTQLIATQGATTEFIQAVSTNNGTRAVGSFEGKDSSGNAVTLKMGGYGDTNRGEIFTHSNHALGFATNNAAAQLILETSGNLVPGGDNTQDLGSTTKRWANVYTGDMHLNNTNTGGNEVDGSEGHWTMQEGSDDLFLINRNTGKKYKFNLTEVS